MPLSGVGRAWIIPSGSEDFQPLTEEVASYEKDGELRLAQSVGTIRFGEPQVDETLPHPFTIPPLGEQP